MYAYMKMYKDGGMLMLHGTAFLRYTQAGSRRDVSAAGKGGKARFDAPSMFMAMYSRPVSDKAQIGVRVMMSLDPLIQRGYGYPLLYQSGELFLAGAQALCDVVSVLMVPRDIPALSLRPDHAARLEGSDSGHDRVDLRRRRHVLFPRRPLGAVR